MALLDDTIKAVEKVKKICAAGDKNSPQGSNYCETIEAVKTVIRQDQKSS